MHGTGAHAHRRLQSLLRHRILRRGIRHHRRSADARVRTPASPWRKHASGRDGILRRARGSPPHRSSACDHFNRYNASRPRRVGSLSVDTRGPSAALQRQALWRLAAAFGTGATLNVAFAPFSLWPIAILAPAALFALIRGLPPRRAGWTGAAFGAGLFAFGTYWLYTCLHVFGLVPLWLTFVLQILLVALMSAYLAALCYFANRFWLKPGATRDWLVLPVLWVLLEWLRGWFLSGFPWLSTGYAMIDSPLSGWAPIFGVYGVTWAAATVSVAIHVAFMPAVLFSRRCLSVAAAAMLFAVPALLARHAWTQAAGAPIAIAAVQGAVPQDQKWQVKNRELTMQRSLRVT